MASVKIDLGFGDQAVLSERTVSRILPLTYQRDVEEFLRRWPRTRSTHEARGYLQQLGLYVAYRPPGVNPADTIALLRSAVQSSRVMIVIERATTRQGGGVGVPSAPSRRAPIEPSRQSFAEMAAGGSSLSVPLDDAVSAPKLYSWLPSYADVSADDLIKYLKSVIGSTANGAAEAVETAGDASTSLGDAEPFSYPEPATTIGDVEQDAGLFLTPAEEAECEMQYEADMAECSAYAAMDRSSWGMCQERAMSRYSNCLRGL